MRRIASHYILYQHCYRLHYVELDERNVVVALHPLQEEIAGTAFYDGILLLWPQSQDPLDVRALWPDGLPASLSQLCNDLLQLDSWKRVDPAEPVQVWHLSADRKIFLPLHTF